MKRSKTSIQDHQMRTKDLIDLADNPNFISGIYNNCDRSCEHCPLVYATENEKRDDPPSRDMLPDDFVN